MWVNKLSPNTQKAVFTIMGNPLKTKNLDLSEVLNLNNCDLKSADKAKSLGVIIDEKLNWEEQFRHTKGKLSGGLAALKRLTNVIQQSQLCNVCFALIESHLRYADVIWGSLSKPKNSSSMPSRSGVFNNNKCKNRR